MLLFSVQVRFPSISLLTTFSYRFQVVYNKVKLKLNYKQSILKMKPIPNFVCIV